MPTAYSLKQCALAGSLATMLLETGEHVVVKQKYHRFCIVYVKELESSGEVG